MLRIILELLLGEKWRAGRFASGPLTRLYLTERFSACHQRPAHKGQLLRDFLPQAHCLFISFRIIYRLRK
jgi:hypothetical protein